MNLTQLNKMANSKRRKMPSRRVIVDYWRAEMPPHLNTDCSINDIQCWACGDSLKIQRAHITARCNGGSDLPENLHLLCSLCHISSEYLEGENYWRWFEYKFTHEFDLGFKRMYPILRQVEIFAKKHGIKCPKDAVNKYMEQTQDG